MAAVKYTKLNVKFIDTCESRIRAMTRIVNHRNAHTTKAQETVLHQNKSNKNVPKQSQLLQKPYF